VWRVEEEGVSWFQQINNQFQPLMADNAGILRSSVFPGLWLDPRALVEMDGAKVLACLQAGMSGSEYRMWRDQLAAQAPQSDKSAP